MNRKYKDVESSALNTALHVFVSVLVIFGLYSCEEYQEGCMDASATNFRISNQLPCCCEYPQLVFQTTLTDDTATLAFADTFVNQLGQRYLIRDLRFIASGIRIADSLDRVFGPTDTFDQYVVSPDILAIDVLNLNSTGANFMQNGRFDEISFDLDKIDELQAKTPGDFPVDHPFRDSVFYDFNRQQWTVAKATIDVVDQGLITIILSGDDWPASFRIPGHWTKSKGNDLTVNFRINIGTLFGGMDFSLPENDLKREFGTNLPASFEP